MIGLLRRWFTCEQDDEFVARFLDIASAALVHISQLEEQLTEADRSGLAQQRITLLVFELLRDNTDDDVLREFAIDKIREYEDDIAIFSEHIV